MAGSSEKKVGIGTFVIMLAVIIFVFIFGYVAGLATELPERFDFDIEVGMDNETKELMNNLQNKTFASECCYPSNCPQAVNNPEQCTCQYMVYCGDSNSKITRNIWECVNESFIHIEGISQGKPVEIYRLIENETVNIYFSELFPKGEAYAPSEDYLNVTYETKERCDFPYFNNKTYYNFSNHPTYYNLTDLPKIGITKCDSGVYDSCKINPYNFSDDELKKQIIKLKANPGYNVPG